LVGGLGVLGGAVESVGAEQHDDGVGKPRGCGGGSQERAVAA